MFVAGLDQGTYLATGRVSGTPETASFNKMTNRANKPTRVAIIGPDHVSATDIYSLLVGGFVNELVLIGKGSRRLISEVESLQRFVAFPHPSRIWAGKYEDAADAEIAIIAFGDPAERSHKTDISIVRGAAMRLKDANFGGMLMVTRDPANILAAAALECSGLPVNKVIGLGAGRLRSAGDRSTWCTALGSDVTFMDNCNADCAYFEQVLRSPGVLNANKNKLRSYAPENIAACVTQVCDAVINDKHSVIPVYCQAEDGLFHLEPCSIGRIGIEQHIAVRRQAHGNESAVKIEPLKRRGGDQLGRI